MSLDGGLKTMANIKKFKNGKITIKLQKEDVENGLVDRDIYFEDMFYRDLCIKIIDSFVYLVDYNTKWIYELGSYLMQNPLKCILDTLLEDGKITFYPLDKEKCIELMEILFSIEREEEE